MSKKHKGKKKFDFSAFRAEAKPILRSAPQDDRPSFSHRYICQAQHCIKLCSYQQLKSLVDKLRILSTLEWKQIMSAPHTTNGCEPINRKALSRDVPDVVPSDAEILVFRFSDGRIAGFRENSVFYILFVDSKFNLYDHG